MENGVEVVDSCWKLKLQPEQKYSYFWGLGFEIWFKDLMISFRYIVQ